MTKTNFANRRRHCSSQPFTFGQATLVRICLVWLCAEINHRRHEPLAFFRQCSGVVSRNRSTSQFERPAPKYAPLPSVHVPHLACNAFTASKRLFSSLSKLTFNGPHAHAAFKTKGLGFASFIKDKTVQAGTQIKQKSTQPDASGQSAYDRVRLATQGSVLPASVCLRISYVYRQHGKASGLIKCQASIKTDFNLTAVYESLFSVQGCKHSKHHCCCWWSVG